MSLIWENPRGEKKALEQEIHVILRCVVRFNRNQSKSCFTSTCSIFPLLIFFASGFFSGSSRFPRKRIPFRLQILSSESFSNLFVCQQFFFPIFSLQTPSPASIWKTQRRSVSCSMFFFSSSSFLSWILSAANKCARNFVDRKKYAAPRNDVSFPRLLAHLFCALLIHYINCIRKNTAIGQTGNGLDVVVSLPLSSLSHYSVLAVAVSW